MTRDLRLVSEVAQTAASFLPEHHRAHATALCDWGGAQLHDRAEPADDVAARKEAHLSGRVMTGFATSEPDARSDVAAFRTATELRASRLLVYHAAWLKDRGAERITIEAATAKSYATEAAQRIIDDAVQMAGGAGVVVGNVSARLYRSIRPLRIYEGTTEIQRLIIADALLTAGGAS